MTDASAPFSPHSLQKTLWQSSIETLLLTDLKQLRIQQVNPASLAFTGYQASELLNQQLDMLAMNAEVRRLYQKIQEAVIQHGFWEGELWQRHRSGSVYHCFARFSQYRPSYGTAQCLVMFNQKQARSDSLIDPLTQLPTTQLLSYILQKTHTFAQRHRKRFAILFIAIEDMSLFNDEHGSELGDELIKTIGRIIRSTVRDSDTVARYRGDVFCVSLEELVHLRDAALVAQMLLFKLTQKLTLSPEYTLNNGVSIGISVYPEDGDQLAPLLQKSEAAMRQAVANGGSRCQFCHGWLQHEFA